MPVKGVLMAFVLAVIVAFVYREPLSEWLDRLCKEDGDDDKRS